MLFFLVLNYFLLKLTPNIKHFIIFSHILNEILVRNKYEFNIFLFFRIHALIFIFSLCVGYVNNAKFKTVDGKYIIFSALRRIIDYVRTLEIVFIKESYLSLCEIITFFFIF